MPAAYRYQPSYDGVELDVTDISTRYGRDVVEHRPASGDGAQVQDMGQQPITVSLTVAITGDERAVLAMRDQLEQLAASGTARTFVHPYRGPMRCRLSQCDVDLVAQKARLTLTEDTPFVRQATPLPQPTLSDIATAGDELDTAIGLIPLEHLPHAPIPSGRDALTMAESWQGQTPVDGQLADLDTYRQQSAETQKTLFATASHEAIDAGLKLQRLRGTLELYQQGLQAARRAYDALTLQSSMPLVHFLTQVYGAGGAALVLDEVLALNSLTDINNVPAGATLRLPRASR